MRKWDGKELSKCLRGIWSGWCQEGSSDKVYMSICLNLDGGVKTINLYQRRGARSTQTDELTGNHVAVVEGKKRRRYSQRIPTPDADHLYRLLFEYLDAHYPLKEPKQKMDGEYFLWEINEAAGIILGKEGFDIGVEYWSTEATKTVGPATIRLMNREGEWKLVNRGFLTPSLSTTYKD